MKFMIIGFASLAVLILAGLILAFSLVAASPPRTENPRDVFGFASMKLAATAADVPPLRRYSARDGEELAYRRYESSSDRILIFIHGSSYHGAGYHALAASVSAAGVAKVVLPNLRGHYQSGRRRGDVDYIGQLEDDLADLIGFLRREGLRGPITLGGHSSGGGLAIRFAGGAHRDLVSSFLMLSPIIPTSPAVRNGTAGGWASLNIRRLYGLLMLNALGIHGFDGLPLVEFNKPPEFWDGTETLSYSYRLNASYHPRFGYAGDIHGLGDRAVVLVGADDEAVDPEALRPLLTASAPGAKLAILPHVNHFGIFSDATALQTVTDWLRSLPTS